MKVSGFSTSQRCSSSSARSTSAVVQVVADDLDEQTAPSSGAIGSSRKRGTSTASHQLGDVLVA